VLLYVPETRFERNEDRTNVVTIAGDAVAPSAVESGLSKQDEKALEVGEVASPASPSTELAEIPKKTFRQELSLWSGTAPGTNLFELFIRPFPLIVYPAVIFAFLGYAVSLAWLVSVNILNPFTLQAPPYNWSPAINGLINIPGLLGNLIGAFTSGWVVDKYCNWRSTKNKGIFEAETRLLLLIIPVVIVPAGCILYGYGSQEALNWTTLFFGVGMISVGLTATPVITMVYVADAYLPVAPDALLLVNGLKNIAAFGFLYGLNPWVMAVGFVKMFWTQAAIYVAIVGGGMALFMAFGKSIRKASNNWRIVL
jgi:MFS family permease